MPDLIAITALGGSAARVDTVAGVTLTENPDLALASVAARMGHEATCLETLSGLLGTDAPAPGKTAFGDPYTAVWMSPDQWMIGADFAAHETLADTLKEALGASASVTEQTDGWVCFDLTGAGLAAVVELLCNVNMRALQAGDATRTTIHHLGCFLVCGDPDGFLRILGPRASAESLHHAIHTAMKSAL